MVAAATPARLFPHAPHEPTTRRGSSRRAAKPSRLVEEEGNGRAALTHGDVVAIRAVPRGYGSMSALAREYWVYVTTIRDILAHKLWRDV